MNRDIIEKLQIWREEDHNDNIILSRHEIIEIIERVKQLENILKLNWENYWKEHPEERDH